MKNLNLERLLPVAVICFLASACAGSISPNAASVEAPLHSWELIWGDEFDAAQIDPAKWAYALDCFDHGNNEGAWGRFANSPNRAGIGLMVDDCVL